MKVLDLSKAEVLSFEEKLNVMNSTALSGPTLVNRYIKHYCVGSRQEVNCGIYVLVE